jgi:hypothetical protein
MPMDDPLHNGEPHPRPFVILEPVEPLEHAEEFFGVTHVEADAVVLDVIPDIVRHR